MIDGLTGDQALLHRLGAGVAAQLSRTRSVAAHFDRSAFALRSGGLGSRAILTLGIRPIRNSHGPKSSIWIRGSYSHLVMR